MKMEIKIKTVRSPDGCSMKIESELWFHTLDGMFEFIKKIDRMYRIEFKEK